MANSRPKSLLIKDEPADFIWQTLKRHGYEQSEKSLLKAIDEKKSNKIVHFATIGLAHIGTRASIPALKALVGNPNKDIQFTAVLAVAKLGGGGETDFLASLLADPKCKDKIAPMAALWEVGSAKALPQVRQLADKLMRDEVTGVDWQHDPLYVTEYLKKHSDAPEDVERRLTLEKMFKKKNWNVVSMFKGLFERSD